MPGLQAGEEIGGELAGDGSEGAEYLLPEGLLRGRGDDDGGVGFAFE